MNLWKEFFELTGWRVEVNAPLKDKMVICVAPHTSNWDFIIGLFAYRSLGRKANFLMKDFWFFFPLKYLLNYLGGIPVPRKKKSGSLTSQIIEMFQKRKYLNLAVTPEGTRKATESWHYGFLYIAKDAKVPVLLAAIDYKNKKVLLDKEINFVENLPSTMNKIKFYYSRFKENALYPEKFIS